MAPNRPSTESNRAIGIAVAVVGIAVCLGLAAVASSPDAAREKPAVALHDLAEQPEGKARFAFVPDSARLDAEALLPDVDLKPAIIHQSDVAAAPWSADIQTEEKAAPLAPQFTVLPPLRSQSRPVRRSRAPGTHTLKSRLAEIAPAASVRLAARFAVAKASWPPTEVALVAIKDEKALELHARQGTGPWQRVHRYRILAASGRAGPKLTRGDKQVPEGIYAIQSLNPNSAYHVSMRVNYPNAFDREMAAKDGRKDLGGDIMIHGKNLSAGCLAMGDEVAEELFVLAARTGLSKTKLIIAPTDFREHRVPSAVPGQLEWKRNLYTEIAEAMTPYKAPPATGLGLLSLFTK